MSEPDLIMIVKSCRFKNKKAKYLLHAKLKFHALISAIRDETLTNKQKRDFLCDNIKGMGMKAASHFLRNLGIFDLAIIDTHIINRFGIEAPKNRNEYRYFEFLIEKYCVKNSIEMHILDAILWKRYSKTSSEDFIY